MSRVSFSKCVRNFPEKLALRQRLLDESLYRIGRQPFDICGVAAIAPFNISACSLLNIVKIKFGLERLANTVSHTIDKPLN